MVELQDRHNDIASPFTIDSYRALSLLDIMNKLLVGEVAVMLDRLRQLVEVQRRKRARDGGDAPLDPEEMELVGELAQGGRTLFSEIEFEEAEKRIALFERGVLSDSTVARMQSEIENLIEEIIIELRKRQFFFVSLDRAKVLVEYPFGEKVTDAFPSTRRDVDHASACLALELHSAAIFHLMRVAEAGLRCLAADRGIKFTEGIELQTWEEVLRELEKSEAKYRITPRRLNV